MERIRPEQIVARSALRFTPLDALICKNMKRPTESSIPVCHFMPLRHFQTLMRTGCLSLCRCDKFEDKDVADGLLPDPNKKTESLTMIRLYQDLLNAPRDFGERTLDTECNLANIRYGLQKSFRTTTYVHCWFEGGSSNPKMWELYGNDGAGVCIESSSFDLCRSVNRPQNVEHFDFGAITYSDCSLPIAVLVGNEPFFHKHEYYCSEREIRMLAYLAHDPKTNKYDNRAERLAIPVRLSTLFHRVVLGKQIDRDVEIEITGLIAGFAPNALIARQS